MRNFAKITFVAIAFAAVPLAFSTLGSVTANAQASVQFDIGNVAIGYSDGYWDRAHTWHTWERPEHRETYRAAKNSEYHESNHDHEKDMGWHERR